MAPLGDAIGRVVARHDVLLGYLLGQPAQGGHPVLERPRADCFRMPARHQVLDMLGAYAGRAQMPETIFVELVGDQCQDAFAIILRSERAIAIALAQLLEIMVEVTHGAPHFTWAWGYPFIRSIHRPATLFSTARCQAIG